MEKFYTEFACDYCSEYPCKRFATKPLNHKIIKNCCDDYKDAKDQDKFIIQQNLTKLEKFSGRAGNI